MDVLTHAQIWAAIDALAVNHGMSASGLARKSGLDPTTFNPSKRFTAAGRERWPSTESIAKIMRCTNSSVDEFMELLSEYVHLQEKATEEPYENVDYRKVAKSSGIPLIASAQAGNGGFFDDGGFPVGHGWDTIDPPQRGFGSSYALRVSGDSMLPLYRDGDILIVDPTLNARKGDRVVAKTQDGEVFGKILVRQSAKSVEFKSVNPKHDDICMKPEELDWVARIIWASQ